MSLGKFEKIQPLSRLERRDMKTKEKNFFLSHYLMPLRMKLKVVDTVLGTQSREKIFKINDYVYDESFFFNK